MSSNTACHSKFSCHPKNWHQVWYHPTQVLCQTWPCNKMIQGTCSLTAVPWHLIYPWVFALQEIVMSKKSATLRILIASKSTCSMSECNITLGPYCIDMTLLLVWEIIYSAQTISLALGKEASDLVGNWMKIQHLTCHHFIRTAQVYNTIKAHTVSVCHISVPQTKS